MSEMPSRALKICFLDLDGVLTSIEDGTSYLCENPLKYGISAMNFKNLQKIIDGDPENTKIVISSNWRRFTEQHPFWIYGGKKYFNFLPKVREKLGKLVLGDIPHDQGLSKSEAMELWFEDNSWFSKTTGHYVILEDDPSREGFLSHPIFSKHLVATSYETGLTEKDAETALKVLH